MSGKKRVAVILFPGTNCEFETASACASVGMDADIVRWNTGHDLAGYDGFILPGGWSYEDRIRAGVIASKDRIMERIKEEAGKGKPVLGICNGAQILIESGMIPGIRPDEVQFALAPNINPFVSGYYCTWVYIKSVAGAGCAFTRHLHGDEYIPIPIAHAEGRFTTRDKDVLDRIVEKNQIAFKYCDKEGNIVDGFPVNPNGSIMNIAGICSPEGNVLAMMPHPERCAWNRQLPGFERHFMSEMKAAGPGRKLFQSMLDYMRDGG